MGARHVEGLVIRVTGHDVWVEIAGRVVPCLLRGRFRQKGENLQVVAGDRVDVALQDSPGTPGAIEGVRPRKSWLSRYVGGRNAGERVIVANLDILVLVVSIRAPKLHFGFTDRVLVSAARGRTEVCMCVNKMDLLKNPARVDGFVSLYESIGYRVIRASAVTGEGVEKVKALIHNGIYAFVGQSGVGKSSLLNIIDRGLNLKVGDVARKTERGRHTTTYSQLFPISGGYVADTPGMQTFGFPGTKKEELSGCFPEFRPLETQCRFQPCAHSHEPDCAVKAALGRGEIAATRYESYQTMLAEVERREKDRY